MRTTVVIDALRSQNGKTSVVSLLENSAGISNISMTIKTKKVSFDYTTHNAMEGLRMRLAEAGFPITQDPTIIKWTDNGVMKTSEQQGCKSKK